MKQNLFNIDSSIENLIKVFEKIRNITFSTLNKRDDGAIGKNFEKLLGIEYNNLQIPDFKGIEIKTKRKNCMNKYITLFNLTPCNDTTFAIKKIQEKFGYPDKINQNFKIFNGDVFVNKIKKIGTNFYFSLFINREVQKIYLLIFDKNKDLIDTSIYWTFSDIKDHLNNKLQFLSLIEVNNKFLNNNEYYKYEKMTLYRLKNFEQFLNAIEKGYIKIQFKIGVFKSGKRFGNIHDRGTGFQIEESYLNYIYNTIYTSN